MNVRWRVVLLSKRLYAYKIILRSWWLAEMSKLTTACLSLLSKITVRIHTCIFTTFHTQLATRRYGRRRCLRSR
jgi:hypothetical protein